MLFQARQLAIRPNVKQLLSIRQLAFLSLILIKPFLQLGTGTMDAMLVRFKIRTNAVIAMRLPASAQFNLPCLLNTISRLSFIPLNK
jgi:hypothetical protein